MNARSLALAACIALLSAVACNAKLSLEGRSCPCTSGYLCCEASHRCLSDDEGALDQNTCGAKSASTNGSKKTEDKEDNAETPELDEPLRGAGVSIASASTPTCFATDDDALYWVNRDGSVGAVRTSDGPPVVIKPFLVPASPIDQCGLARAGDSLFATLAKGNSVLRLSVRRDTSGITIGETADRIGTLEEPIALAAADETTLFVAELTTKKIKRLDVATGTTVDITTSARPVRELLVTGSALVWSDGGVATRSTEPGSSRVYLSTADDASDLVVRDGRVYFLAERRVWSAPLSGQAASQQETGSLDKSTPNSGLSSLAVFAFDGPKLVTVQGSNFYEASLDGAAPRPLFKMQSSQAQSPRFLRIDAKRDAKRYLWASPTAIWSATRPIGSDVSP